MEVISQEQLATRLDFMRPLKEEPEEPEGIWCIPFEWGANGKGTKISIAKAKEIAAELRRLVAEAEMRELRRAFDREVERGKELSARSSEHQREAFELQGQVANLKAQVNKLKRAQRKPRKPVSSSSAGS